MPLHRSNKNSVKHWFSQGYIFLGQDQTLKNFQTIRNWLSGRTTAHRQLSEIKCIISKSIIYEDVLRCTFNIFSSCKKRIASFSNCLCIWKMTKSTFHQEDYHTGCCGWRGTNNIVHPVQLETVIVQIHSLSFSGVVIAAWLRLHQSQCKASLR